MGRLFNGSSDVISNTSIATVGATGSMSLWLQPNWNWNDTADHPFWMEDGDFFTFQKYSDNNIYCGFRRGASDQRIALAATGLFTSGTWAHWLLTWSNAAGQTLYQNGVSVGTHSLTYPSPVNPNGLWVGNYGTFAPVNSNETIADFAYWNSTLSSSDAAKLAAGYRPVDVNSANLQVWWPLSGYSSPEPDSSGNANNGTLTGTSQAPMPPSLGRGGRSFNGTSNKIVGSSNISNISNVTIAAWAYCTTSSNIRLPVFSCGDSALDGFGLVFTNGTVRAGALGGVAWVPGTTTFTANSWHHLAMTGTSGFVWQFYADGVADGPIQTVTPIAATHAPAFGWDSTPAWFPGSIADCAAWNTVLTPTQILALASGTRPNQIAAGNLLGYWPLNSFSNSAENDASGGGNNGTLSPGSASGPFPILGPPQTWRLG
jgi:hypothetical protein